MDLGTVKDAFLSAFSQLFPRSLDAEISIDAPDNQDSIYLDLRLRHGEHTYRLKDLERLPSRIKIGPRHFKVSRKHRQTLKAISEWDPIYDPRRGFVFAEKDVPEILNYLRTKATADFHPNASRIRVENRPLEYAHEISEKRGQLDIQTSLIAPDETARIDEPSQIKLVEGSKFAHVREGYFKKPAERRYKTFRPEIGLKTFTDDQIPLFLLYDLKKLIAEGRTRADPRVLSQRVIADHFLPKVSLHVDGPWVWFDIRYEADRFKIPYGTVEQVVDQRQFIRQEDTWLQIDKDTHNRVAHQVALIPEVDRVDQHFRTPTRNYQDVQDLLAAVAHIDLTEAYAKFLQSLADFQRIEEQPLPYSLRQADKVRPYQRHGYDWLCFLRNYGLNGILADEMGLGKTLQTLICLLDAHSRENTGTSLIVCPPSVLSAWEDDLQKFTSPVDFRVARYIGLGRKDVLQKVKHYDVLLTTYTVVRNDIHLLSRITWEYVVLAEAQKIKNADTATAKACKELLAKSKLVITGTPIENRLSELWSLYDFLMPSYLGPYHRFRETVEIPIMRRGDRKTMQGLKKRIGPFKLRRQKKQVEKDLPEKIYLERYCELTPEQVGLYRQFALAEQDRIKKLPGNTIRIDTSILTAILRLKQICCHPALVTKDYDRIYDRSGKLEAFIEVLEELVENEEKALVFSQFTEMLGILQSVMKDKKLPFFYLDGSTPQSKRAELKNRFQSGEVPFFLISLRAGGLGMTLTEANCVVHFDRWWNPAVEDQATDRVHRIGQEKTVRVFRIHTLGTIDERIGELIIKKKDLFDAVIEVDDLKKEITKEELLALFEPPKLASTRS